MRQLILLVLIALLPLGAGAKNINLNVPGSLSAVLTKAEKDTITSLVLSGNIDARDFKTMRDSMAVLKSVDMGNAHILFYLGTNGTNSSSLETVYAADAIPSAAFYGSNKLVSMVLPATATSIENMAFNGCVNIAVVSINAGVVTIGLTAFRNCSAYLTVDAGNSVYSSENGLLYDKAKTTVMSCPVSATGTLVLASTLTAIRSNVFENCVLLDKVVIPESVSSIESAAFRNCSAEFNVSGANALYAAKSGVLFNKERSTLIQCPVSTTGLFEVPSTVSTIGYCAFFNCKDIKQLAIPESVMTIETYAFSGCSGLESVTVYSKSPIAIQKNDFNGVPQSTCVLYVPKGTKTLYESQYYWYRFENISEFVPSAVISALGDNEVVVSERGVDVISIQKPLKIEVIDVLGRIVLRQETTGSTFIGFHQLGKGIFVVSVNGQSTKIDRR